MVLSVLFDISLPRPVEFQYSFAHRSKTLLRVRAEGPCQYVLEVPHLGPQKCHHTVQILTLNKCIRALDAANRC
jgi:hypothetical protein